MELSRENVLEMVGIIKANYPYTYKDVDDNTMRLLIETWFMSLSKYDKRVIDVAFRRAIETCKVPPTLADILGNIKDIEQTTEATDTELWEQLVRAIDKAEDYSYHFNFGLIESNGKTQGENFKDKFMSMWNELPQLLKDYCGDPNGLITLSKTRELSYEKGRFLRALPTLRQRQEIKQKTNPEILKLVSELTKNFDEGNLLSYDEKK